MNDVGALLHDPAGAEPLARAWTELTGPQRAISPTKRSSRAARFSRRTCRRNSIARRARCIASRAIRSPRAISRFTTLRRVVAELVVQFPGVSHLSAERRAQRRGRTSISSRRWTARARRLSRADHVVLDQVDAWLGGKRRTKRPRARRRASAPHAARRDRNRRSRQRAASQRLAAAHRADAVLATDRRRSPRRPSRIRRAIAMDGCCRATKSAPIRANSRCRSRRFTRAIWSARSAFRTRCSPPRRTITSAAKTCARGSRCSARSPTNGRDAARLVDAERAASSRARRQPISSVDRTRRRLGARPRRRSDAVSDAGRLLAARTCSRTTKPA